MKLNLILSLLALAVSGSANADLLLKKNAEDLFVRFDASLSEAQQNVLLARKGLKIEWRSTLVRGLVRAKSVNDQANLVATAITGLNAVPGVLYAEPNHRHFRKLDPIQKEAALRSFFSEPSDPYLSRQWALTSPNGVNPQGAWKTTTGSRSIRVAVLDTGAQVDHVELSDRLLPGYDFIENSSEMVDTHGHGTHVSGIIGARWNNGAGIAGVNEHVSIIPVRVVPDNGDETDAGLIEAFEFAVKKGARIANCSFGKDESGTAVRDVMEAAGEKGLLIVVAAGNDSQNLERNPQYPAAFQTSNEIVVGASTEAGRLAFFSNHSNKLVHIAAPGARIISSVSPEGYQTWDGTSMATPQVAGVAALVLAANPELTVQQLKEVLLSTAAKRDNLSSTILTGGLVDASAAVEAALQLKSRTRN